MSNEYQKFIQCLLHDYGLDIHDSMNADYFNQLYQQLFKFANHQLKNHAWAEDAVQECLIAAMQYSGRFQGNSAFKSWVFSILKHKITDIIRKNQKYITMSDLHQESDQDFEMIDFMFSEQGEWQQQYVPKSFDQTWFDPVLQAENQHFWHTLEFCLEHLSGEQARVFLMKEYIDLEVAEICKVLHISRENYYVLMYRARLQLQMCLTRHWLNDE